MNEARRSGVLLHISSLPGPHGVGEIGPEAFRFIDVLRDMRQSVWQILPINPTDRGEAPYTATSSFAGAEHLICLSDLAGMGLLGTRDLRPLEALPRHRVAFGQMFAERGAVLRRACRAFLQSASGGDRAAFDAFRQRHDDTWLSDYALFTAISDAHRGAQWMDWPSDIARRTPAGLERARSLYAERIEEICVAQFLFDRQWSALREHARQAGVEIFGDVPIYVAQNSADVWASPQFFQLDEKGHPTNVAGCPPDAFAVDGQRWGNPLYDWSALQRDGFAWWIARVQRALELVDIVRVDHFRAFAGYWSIPASEPTGRAGVWRTAPGGELFAAMRRTLGETALVAEDLGFITPDVLELRDSFGLPGMKIVQFEIENGAFAEGNDPEDWSVRSVSYLGTHDNETAHEWLARQLGEVNGDPSQLSDRQRRLEALIGPLPEAHWGLIAQTFRARSSLAVVQLQDILGLGAEGRMNTPGVPSGNWSWRFDWPDLTPDMQARFRSASEVANRAR